MRGSPTLLALVTLGCTPASPPQSAQDEQEVATPPQPASEGFIHVNLRNDCDAPRRLARQSTGNGPIAAAATIIELAANERRVIEIRGGEWLRAIEEDGSSSFSASLGADEDGGSMIFTCDSVRAMGPGISLPSSDQKAASKRE